MSDIPGTPPNLPLDSRSNALKIPIIVLVTFSSIFVLFRLVVSFRNRNFFLLTDHLLWTGHVLAIAGAACCYVMADYGGGKHIWDPVFKDPANLREYLRFLWFGQLLNLYGMALVKLSICAYIFMLNFSKGFRALILASVVVHIGLNFVFPTVILFGECTPYSKHWDALGTQPGSCWSTKPKVISVWGVRIVFLLGLITTTISALKLYEMKSLNSSPDPTYSSVNLSVYAIAEVFVGVFTACLPPLRKTFDGILRKVLPDGLMSSNNTKSRQSYALKAFSDPLNSASKPSKSEFTSDGDSDYAILEAETSRIHGSQDDIIKTTQVTVTVDDQASERQERDEWV
ncbi:hypothetical protein SNOG_06496 [Parastagonospora nodorum SN15]|uniref:Rhodopsin domain-containing protein n=1 Tax=Phaeosphaeria nodorum (strain SN15 / ATCC MYA-4574 / FGSC 10173) TaxID=321614 RepID=Q0UP18_PHANO|nr:hypothetical protein SNOG_06496 [Parastagonospora nodorum SN15]EAT86327.1 hypothetical protein SNOG_06496 [Parastagonospora nodorum SN15]